jgi:hypothetical protein
VLDSINGVVAVTLNLGKSSMICNWHLSSFISAEDVTIDHKCEETDVFMCR